MNNTLIKQEFISFHKEESVLETHLSESSPIYLGHDIWQDSLLEKMERIVADRFYIITDTNIEPTIGQRLYNHLRRNFPVKLIALPAGEPNKTIANVNYLVETLFEEDVSKSSVLIALGGGVIGNITGLAAALIFRGIRFFHIPTTFLAQTDSIMSRKQGVNSIAGKNMIGLYYTPIFSLIDTSFLISESERFLRASLVETVKNGLIYDRRFFEKLKDIIVNQFELSEGFIHNLVRMSIESKIPILKADPSEKKLAMILEYGHTVGHAVERLCKGELSHGECVSIGMVVAARISRKLGYLSEREVQEHIDVLTHLKTPTKIPSCLTISDIIKRIELDNKKDISGVRFVILKEIGKCVVDGDYHMIKVEPDIVKAAIQESY
ncbi:MAG: 2-deoxy-scyllo-inosose synthase [Clostridia bacterium]|nr:2-deoxy-scyllo-inosose synthase [Clostridia bacterium]